MCCCLGQEPRLSIRQHLVVIHYVYVLISKVLERRISIRSILTVNLVISMFKDVEYESGRKQLLLHIACLFSADNWLVMVGNRTLN